MGHLIKIAWTLNQLYAIENEIFPVFGLQGPPLLTGININYSLVWISDHMPSKVWDEITYPLSIPKPEELHRWGLRMDEYFHLTL